MREITGYLWWMVFGIVKRLLHFDYIEEDFLSSLMSSVVTFMDFVGLTLFAFCNPLKKLYQGFNTWNLNTPYIFTIICLFGY